MGSDEHGPAYPEPLDPRCPVCRQDNDWCMQDNCPGRNRLPPHVPENVAEFHRRISAQHERDCCCERKVCTYDPDVGCGPRPTSDPRPVMHTEWCRRRWRHCLKCTCVVSPSHEPAVKCAPCLLISTLLALALIGALLISCARPAAAMDHGFDKTTARSKFFAQLLDHSAEPDLFVDPSAYFAQLLRQDKLPDPCCGKADAYEADIYKHNPRTALEPWGSYDVTITNGEDPKPWPDGTHRTPIKNGTTVHVPGNKVNPPKETMSNPTGHSWLFVSTKRDIDGVVAPDHTYCFAPLPEGS